MLSNERMGNLSLQIRAGATRAVSRIIGNEPSVYAHDDGGTTELHRRFGTPEESRWIQLRDERLTVASSTDIAIQTDKSGLVFDSAKVKNTPLDTIVFAEGLPILDKIETEIRESGGVFRKAKDAS